LKIDDLICSILKFTSGLNTGITSTGKFFFVDQVWLINLIHMYDIDINTQFLFSYYVGPIITSTGDYINTGGGAATGGGTGGAAAGAYFRSILIRNFEKFS